MTVTTNLSAQLASRIENRVAHVAVVGAGYVGLGAAVQSARAGFSVTAIDLNPERVAKIEAGQSYIGDIESMELQQLVHAGRLRATTDYNALREADVVLICVPTPLTRNRVPDLTWLRSAVAQVAERLHPGQLVALESTTYPGTTEEEVLPTLSARGLKVGEDFFLVFSPERIDPGNGTFHVGNLVRVLGPVTAACREVGTAFYAAISAGVKVVSSPRTAELAKLFENLYRAVNIALVNEMAILCDRMRMDVWEVIEASASKPFGIQVFWPGPGVGGHCIPLDPAYLKWKAMEYDVPLRFVSLAEEINGHMPDFVVQKLNRLLNARHLPLQDARVLVVGVAYKRDVADVREAPAFRIIRLLLEAGAHVAYHDPLIPILSLDEPPTVMESVPLSTERLEAVDAAVIVTDHTSMDYARLLQHVPLLLDTRGVTARLGACGPNVYRL